MSNSYKLSQEAGDDWYSIVEYSLEKFGERQVQKYTNNLLQCLNDLAQEKGQFKQMNISGHRVLIKRCQKHFIFALSQVDQPLIIIAIFHEQMDLINRLKSRLI